MFLRIMACSPRLEVKLCEYRNVNDGHLGSLHAELVGEEFLSLTCFCVVLLC